MMTDDLESDLKELSSAEDFLDYFGIAYDPRIVQVNRLHILQRLHDYLDDRDEMPDADASCFALYANLLQQAYQDFVVSDARSEKVFRVFQQRQPEPVTIPLSDLLAPVPTERDAHETQI